MELDISLFNVPLGFEINFIYYILIFIHSYSNVEITKSWLFRDQESSAKNMPIYFTILLSISQ